MEWKYDDGGRAAAGFKTANDAGDCAARAVAIATGLPYEAVYKAIASLSALAGHRRSARDGVRRDVLKALMQGLGWQWTPTMQIGQGCTIHLRAEELPPGRLVVQVTKHWCAVIDGVIYDNHDPSRDGTRCVYGYWQLGVTDAQAIHDEQTAGPALLLR